MLNRYRYSRSLTVPVYDCDPFGRAKVSSLLKYIQAVSGEHLDTIGLTHDRLLAEGFVFVVAGTALKIFRCPKVNEKITLFTAPLDGGGAHMPRETVIVSESGEKLVECQADWALTDINIGKLLRASDFPYDLPRLQGEWTPFSDPRKLRIKGNCGKTLSRTVRLTDLDSNMHMNNTVYADVITDCFGEEILTSNGIDELFIKYHLQARLGDELTLDCGQNEGVFTVEARCSDKRCFGGAFSLKPLETV
ncbi:MAG: hypothetical protein J6B55_05545 [Clostridia bacterium]|nr:hypothetical protein [Clostridia bacterium]